MLDYAQSRGHCLMTGAQLLAAWLDAKANPARRDEIISAIYACSGRFDRYTETSEWIEKRSEDAVTEDDTQT